MKIINIILSISLLGACAQVVSVTPAPKPSSTPAPMPSSLPSPLPMPFEIEIVIRTIENFQRESDVATLVEMAARCHVSVISLLVKQDEDAFVPSGQVFYRSKIAPIAPGYMRFDVLQTLIQAAHPLGIKVRAWLPQFHDQAAAKRHPDWQMLALKDGQVVPYSGSNDEEFFVNPLNPEVQQYELSLIKEVAENYAVDGIMLDWLRFDDYNMDLSKNTRQSFQAATGLDPLMIDFANPGSEREAWNGFRTDAIADYVRSVRENLPADLPLGVYILPPDFVEVGQDAAKFNTHVDFLAPMCYFRDWDFPLEWVWNNCLATTAQKAGKASILPTMDSHLTDAQYRQIISHIRQDYPQVNRLSWFYHEQWTEEMLKRIDQISSW